MPAPNDAAEEASAPAAPPSPDREVRREAAETEVLPSAPTGSDIPPELRPKPAPVAPGGPKRKALFDESIGPKVEKPNIRAALSPDLEQELAEALGETSFEQILETDDRSKQAAAGLEPEARVKARVLRIHRDEIFVELPGLLQGTVPLRHFPEPPEPGAVLDVVVGRFNAEEGLYELTAPSGAIDVGDWSDISEGMVVEARVTGHNKGGLEVDVNRIRGFIPISQVSLYRVEDLAPFVGQKLPCVVTEANRERRNLVLSHRALLERQQAEAKEKLLSELKEGQEREGVVRNIREFGAFVDLGGVDGMLHVSQMSWDRIKHPSDVLTLGQKIKVKIQKIDPATNKISLSYRDTFANPWSTAATRYPVTARVKGTVTKIMDFGAFVRLESGIEGLVHISELSHRRVFRVSDVVKEGQEVEAKVLSVDPENQRMSLSIKALEGKLDGVQPKEPEPEEEVTPARPTPKRTTRLKGGLGSGSGGDQFGLKW